MNWRKDQNHLTAFSDLVAKRVLYATPGKEASVLAVFFAEMPRHEGYPKAIQQVNIELYAT